MTAFVARQTMTRSADDVWAYAADIGRHPEWMSVTSAQVLEGPGTRAGARGQEHMRFGPFGWDVVFEVTEAVPGRRIVWKAVSGAPFDLTVSLDLQPAGPTSTNATYGSNIRLHGLWRLLGPILAMDGKSSLERELRRLRTQVEVTSVGGGSPN